MALRWKKSPCRGDDFIALVASFSIISTLIMMATRKRASRHSQAWCRWRCHPTRVHRGRRVHRLDRPGVGVSTGVVGCKLIEKYGLPCPRTLLHQQTPVVMRPSEIWCWRFGMALCCLATVYPALLASRMRPVDGLRYE